MDKTQQKLLGAFWEKSNHCLAEADDLFEHGHFEGTVSRAYYAAFHAAQSILITEGFSAETHHGVLTLFSLHFVKTQRLDLRYKSTLRELKEKRQSGDYDAYSAIDSSEAELALKNARGFVLDIGRFLEPFLKSAGE